MRAITSSSRHRQTDPDRIHRLLGPGVADLLRWTIQRLFCPVGPMHDVVPSVDRVVEGLFQFLFVPLELFGNPPPRVVDPSSAPVT